MIGIVGIGGGDAGEQILIGFAGQEIAVLQRFLAKIGQQVIARGIGDNDEAAIRDRLAVWRSGSGRFRGGGRGSDCGRMEMEGRS